MNTPTTERRIIETVAQQLGINEEGVTRKSRLIEDLGADSLDTIEMAMIIEERHGIEVNDDDIEGIITVGDLVNMVDRLATSN